MSESEFAAYASDALPHLANEKVKAGQWMERDSLRLAHEAFNKFLPDGLKTPGNFLYRVRSSTKNADVGMVWFVTKERGERGIVAYIYDIIIDPEYRRKGYGALTLSALEKKARSQGISKIELHVFGHNTAARALYEKAGFRATSITMCKEIG